MNANLSSSTALALMTDVSSDASIPPVSNQPAAAADLKEFFAIARERGRAVGEGKSAISDFAIEMADAAGRGILQRSTKKKGEESHAHQLYAQYRKGEVTRCEDDIEANKDSLKKQVSYFERFINLGQTLAEKGEGENAAKDLLERGRAIITSYSQERRNQEDKDDMPALKGGTYQNLYNLAGEQLSVDEDTKELRYSDGDSIRTMTDDEIRAFVVPGAKDPADELKRARQIAKVLEDMASKFQDGPYEVLTHQLNERIHTLTEAKLAAEGIELVRKAGDSPLTDKQIAETIKLYRAGVRF